MKFALITGASKGFGKSIAMAFAREGYGLLLCSRGIEALKSTAEELKASFTDTPVFYTSADLSVKEEVADFADWAGRKVDRIDILVNNAGRFIPGNIADEPDGVLEEMINTNLYSAYHLTRALLPTMLAAGNGHIFNICSIASLQSYPNGGAYSISKYALNGFSANLRFELRNKGIKVTSVFPGAAFTDSWAGSGIDPQRIMEADDIASMVVAASKLSAQACVEEIVLRPQLGDL